MFPKGGMGGMYKKAQEMQKKMAEIQTDLENMEVEGNAGGDMVKVVVTGNKKVNSVKLSADLLNEEKEMVEDLILVAINQALDKVDSISKKKMGSLTGGMNIPGYFQTNIVLIKYGLLNKSFLKNVNLKLGINNLFDYTNFEDTTFQNPGRTYSMEVGFNYDFK